MKDKKEKKVTLHSACPILDLKNKNELLMISTENWNTQENRTFIMNADFRQMDSAKNRS